MFHDDQIQALMANAAMLLEDASARMLLDPLDPLRTSELRAIAADLYRIASEVEAIHGTGG